MGRQGGVPDQEALVAAVALALRSQSRRSVHPADHAALRHAAASIAAVLRERFFVRARHELSAELTDHAELNTRGHE
jgi:hypothetical protein